MKKPFILIMLAAMTLLLVGCKEDDPVAHTLTLNPTSTTILEGELLTIEVEISPAVADAAIDWRSSDKSVVKVKNGKLTGVAAGRATVTATCQIGDETLTARCKVEVLAAGLQVTPREAEIVLGETQQLTANEQDVTWLSDDQTIATVDQTGLVTAVSVGSTWVYAMTTEDTVVCRIIVLQPGINILPLQQNITMGDMAQLTYRVVGVEPSEMTWSSSDSLIAIVDQNGSLTAYNQGTTTITLTMDTYTSTLDVEVHGISIIQWIDRLAIGEQYTFEANTADIWWESSDESVLSITRQGVATGVATGVARVIGHHGVATVCRMVMVGDYQRPAFSVSATAKVYIAPGNLQYRPSTDTWRFAPNQWDVCGAANDTLNRVSTYSGWLDLFCWGTGFSDPLVWRGHWPKTNVIFYDWGNASIYEGSMAWLGGSWHTPTEAEYTYLISTRTGATALRGLATVGSQTGLIILPDEFSMPDGFGSLVSSITNFSDNNYTLEQWTQLEMLGAIFLPSAGYVGGNAPKNVGVEGDYWINGTKSSKTDLKSTCYFYEGHLTLSYYDPDHCFSVRLVRPAE